MRQRVLITGGSGLLALNWALAMRDHFDIILGLHSRKVSLLGVDAKEINLESINHLMKTVEEIECNFIINAVGFTNVEKCELQPDLAHHLNVTLAKNLAIVCSRLNIKLIHISTDHLFSGKEALVTEDHPASPVNVYGKTKALAEKKVLECNPEALVIRTNFYGWGTIYRTSFSDLIIKTLRLSKEIHLFQDVFYTPILIETAAKVIHELVDLKASGVFNVVGNERISKYNFGMMVSEIFGLNSSGLTPELLANHEALARRPYDMSLSNQKVCNFIGRQLEGVVEQIYRLLQQEREGQAKELENV